MLASEFPPLSQPPPASGPPRLETHVASPPDSLQTYPLTHPHAPQSPWWHVLSSPHTQPGPHCVGPVHERDDDEPEGTHVALLPHVYPEGQSAEEPHVHGVQAGEYVGSGQS
jgi:hypothetical protein